MFCGEGRSGKIYPSHVRSIATVTAALLVVIGIGVGLEGAVAKPAVGTIYGVVRVVGGVSANPGYHSVVGTVTATSSSGETYTTPTGPSGLFSMELSPGTYLVSATSQSMQQGAAVAGPLRISLAASEKVSVKLAFQIP